MSWPRKSEGSAPESGARGRFLVRVRVRVRVRVKVRVRVRVRVKATCCSLRTVSDASKHPILTIAP